MAASTFAVAVACDEQNSLPTSPRIASPVRAQATIVGANTIILPTLGGVGTSARSINDAGQVVGWSSTGATYHAFLWTQSLGMRDLGTLGGPSSSAFAINNNGAVVGVSDRGGTGARPHAFLWTSELGMRDLGALVEDFSVAQDINDAGQVVGYTGDDPRTRRAFLWTAAGGMLDLGTLGGSSAAAAAINNAGQVVGSSLAFDGLAHAFLWTAATGMQDLGLLPGFDYSAAQDINEAGLVIGAATRVIVAHGFLWTPGSGLQDLGTIPGYVSTDPLALNDVGQVVGFVEANGPWRPFLWTSTDGIVDLSPYTGVNGIVDINNRGQVVGNDRVVTLQFQNRVPVASVGGPYTGIEGSAVAFAFSGSDPDADALTYAWDLGDGSTGSGLTPPASHVYADNGTYSVRLTVSDGKGGSDTRTTTATIANDAPTIQVNGLTGPASPVPVVAGSAIAPITLAFTDPAGTNDRYAAELQCGNGVVLTPTAVTAPYTASCTYASAGLYTVRATVSDEDGGSSVAAVYRYVIVYDPAGAFATGSGFYDVPGRRSSKAHFTFSAKFPPGQSTTPNGNLRFWIPGDGVDFESSTIDMLVASGPRAQFWGAGTLNGATVRFRITVVDGDVAGNKGAADAIRVELWNAAGALLYDTQLGAAQDAPVTTTIGGGNIQVRR